jgi:hypothetical protein
VRGSVARRTLLKHCQKEHSFEVTDVPQVGLDPGGPSVCHYPMCFPIFAGQGWVFEECEREGPAGSKVNKMAAVQNTSVDFLHSRPGITGLDQSDLMPIHYIVCLLRTDPNMYAASCHPIHEFNCRASCTRLL